jgi:phage replication-related protein YjqB (UPF0714/DUF867 family)
MVKGMTDKYNSFEELTNQAGPQSYNIIKNDCKNNFLIFTPHGGGIEPGTSEICRYLASNTYSFYMFEGIGKSCKSLHITSSHFDEPVLLKMLANHTYAISVHGMTNKMKNKLGADIFLGGLNQNLIKITMQKLKDFHFKVVSNLEFPNSTLSGKDGSNVTNKCLSSKGMQTEISEDLRSELFRGDFKLKKGRKYTTEKFRTLHEAINQSIIVFENSLTQPV